MKLEKPKYEIIYPQDFIIECKKIERMGRICYKSEDRIIDDSWKKFVTMLREKQHGAMLEHSSMSVIFTTDRGVSHELVRHRLASFAQESTRYCNYSKEKFDGQITFIEPWHDKTDTTNNWRDTMAQIEKSYHYLIENGYSPQIARSVLPNSLKTEIGVTANFREWLHIFELRISVAAHPAIVSLLTPLYQYLNSIIPEIFTIEKVDKYLENKKCQL